MMLNPQTMTESEERNARDRTFYLLKKFTSYTFIDYARGGYREFLNAFARQLNDPQSVPTKDEEVQRNYSIGLADGFYEARYRSFLKQMIPVEEGLELLRTTSHKEEAYRAILGSRFTEGLWGKGAEEWGLVVDPFYMALGLRTHSYDPSCNTVPAKHEASVLKVDEADDCIMAAKRTVFGYDWWLKDRERVACHWTYESFFDNYDAYGRNWPPISFPQKLPSCPAKNPTPEGQIWSGEEIPTTGIWEPWFAEESLLGGVVSRLAGKQPTTLTGKVGCPNYFLAGATAFEYEIEGTDKKEKVAWRLLWEDTRYLDGTIPEEENEYFAAPAASDSHSVSVLTARPGEPCPEAGEWYSVNWESRKAVLEQGDPMPGPEYGKTGVVIWHLNKGVKR